MTRFIGFAAHSEHTTHEKTKHKACRFEESPHEALRSTKPEKIQSFRYLALTFSSFKFLSKPRQNCDCESSGIQVRFCILRIRRCSTIEKPKMMNVILVANPNYRLISQVQRVSIAKDSLHLERRPTEWAINVDQMQTYLLTLSCADQKCTLFTTVSFIYWHINAFYTLPDLDATPT